MENCKILLENKTKNVPPIWGQSSSIVTPVDVNINNNNNNNVNDGDNGSSNPSDFVTSTSSNVATSINVVSVTTPSFVPAGMEITIPSHVFSPTVPFGESSDTPLHSPSFDDDDDAIGRYNDLINGAGKQADK
jgi:hypothetical protein